MATPGKRAGGGAGEATARCGDSARTRRRLGSIWTRNSGGTEGGRTEEAAVGREGGRTARKLARRGSGAGSAAGGGGLYANEARFEMAWAPPLRPRLYANNARGLAGCLTCSSPGFLRWALAFEWAGLVFSGGGVFTFPFLTTPPTPPRAVPRFSQHQLPLLVTRRLHCSHCVCAKECSYVVCELVKCEVFQSNGTGTAGRPLGKIEIGPLRHCLTSSKSQMKQTFKSEKKPNLKGQKLDFLFKNYLLDLFIFILCVLLACVAVHHVHAWYLLRERSVRSLELELRVVVSCCPSECWEPNSGHLQE